MFYKMEILFLHYLYNNAPLKSDEASTDTKEQASFDWD